MKFSIRKILIGLTVTITILSSSFSALGGIAVLNVGQRNGELEESGDYSRQLYSATYLCDIAGYPYIVTKDLNEAMKEKVLMLSSCLTNSTFSLEELQSIAEWVKKGGVIIAPCIKSVASNCKDITSEIFGIDATKNFPKATDRKLINWKPEYFSEPELSYFDEPEERETSVGSVKTFSFTPDVCEVLAQFSNGKAAVARNTLGEGKAYLLSITWRDVVQRNQLNKDQSASRQYNNGFEPSADIWAFFLRSIHSSVEGISAWKFTVPAGYTQVLVPTHDCDSRTAYDAMHYMSDYEKSLGLSGHYFLTTHYYSDKKNFGVSYLSDFYNEETIPNAKALLKNGHTVGSHSVCHFPDFSKTSNTDVVTREEYAMRATCEDGVSRGVSTWAEIVMSKQIIEEDLGNHVRSFRSGHLCVNPDFHSMLEEGNYNFQSCYTGGDLLSEFPFFGRYDNTWEKDQSKVLTIQLHISDVYNGNSLTDDNWSSHRATEDWKTAMRKLRGNYASAVLLIHPNREWKMTLQKILIESLDPNEVGLYNFEDYGDFWLSRLSTDYTYNFDATSGVLTITTDTEAVRKSKLTFGVDDFGKEVKKIVVSHTDGSVIYGTNIKKMSDTRYLVSTNFSEILSGVSEISSDNFSRINGLYDINGNIIISGEEIDETTLTRLPKGIYILKQPGGTKKIKI